MNIFSQLFGPRRTPRPVVHRGARAALVLAALLGPLLLGLTGCGDGGRPRPVAKFIETREVMSTVATVTVIAPGTEEARAGIEAAFAALDSVDLTMNAHDETSALARLNRLAGQRAVSVDRATFAVLRAAQRFSILTGGAFDVTVGPLLTFWRRCAEENRWPTPAEVAAARGPLGAQRIELGQARRTVRFATPETRVDLGGIAKGYAIDAAVAALERGGLSAGLVDVGGDLRCFGEIPEALIGRCAEQFADGLWQTATVADEARRGWPLGVQNPFAEDLLGKIRTGPGAVATSGHYRRHATIQGRRVSHILDPRTGYPVDDPASVTVLAPDALTADALATAITVLGRETGLALADSLPEVEALVITGTLGAPQLHPTKGFPQIEPLPDTP